MTDPDDQDDEPGLLERCLAWTREHPWATAIAIGLPLTLGPVLAWAAWDLWRSDDELEVTHDPDAEVPVDP